MRIPHADRAIVAAEKLRDYLLNTEHPRGASKAIFLRRLGYSPAFFQRLEADLRRDHLSQECDRVIQSDYGTRFEIHAPITAPNGRIIRFCSIWQIDTGMELPRLITLYPD